MRAVSWLLVVLAAVACKGKGPDSLLLITENGLYGFIDSTGKTVIQPQYKGAGIFSEGLAPVRVKGRYGYIDVSGKMVIAPQFDFAEEFSEGTAIAYKDGKPFMIDHTGNSLFDHPYAQMSKLIDERSIVTTASYKSGIIDKTGKLIADTIYLNIDRTPYKSFIIQGVSDTPHLPKSGIIDANGKWIVPLGKYSYMRSFENGYASAVTADGLDELIDSSGRVVNSEYAEALKALHYKYVFGFTNGRAFALDSTRKYWLIDARGKPITRNYFEDVLAQKFYGAIAFVKQHGKWGAIDTTGRMTIMPAFDGVDQNGIFGDCFVITKPGNDGNLYGLADMQGNILMRPRFSNFDERGFKNGLWQVMEANRLGYVNRKGEYIWREPRNAKHVLDTLDIDLMNPAYCACSPLSEKLESQGRSVNDNFPQEISAGKSFAQGKFYVEARPQDTCSWQKDYAGMKLYVVNNSRQTILFHTVDSRLELVVQARDGQGNWKDIEYLPVSSCLNSRYQVKLPPHYYLQFAMPLYKGQMKTTLRARLMYTDPADVWKSISIYSNEFQGSVNPAQFWRQPYEYAKDLIDVYWH